MEPPWGIEPQTCSVCSSSIRNFRQRIDSIRAALGTALGAPVRFLPEPIGSLSNVGMLA
jgi:hypothetical protein